MDGVTEWDEGEVGRARERLAQWKLPEVLYTDDDLLADPKKEEMSRV